MDTAIEFTSAVAVAAPCLLRGYYTTNTNEDQFQFVHLFDSASLPGGITGVKWTIALPKASGANVSWDNGITFDNGIAVRFSTSSTSVVAPTAGEILINLVYELTP